MMGYHQGGDTSMTICFSRLIPFPEALTEYVTCSRNGSKQYVVQIL